MRRFFLYTSLFVLAVPLILFISRWYPVAVVENTVIFQRTWERAVHAAVNFTNAQSVSGGFAPINFFSDEHKALLNDIQRGTLTFLIEDVIITQEGTKLLQGFERVAMERVSVVIENSSNLKDAAAQVYGLDLDDFKLLVLLPQSKRDIMRETLVEEYPDFDEWLNEVKSAKYIRLMFVPFRWNGKMVE